MQCPSCKNSSTKVIDSRVSDAGASTRRRRVCEACEFRFTTFERAQTTNLLVKKRDGTTEAYEREKLERSIMLACAKRPVDMQKLREKISFLEESRWTRAKMISAEQMGEDMMIALKDVDPVAYLRYASVYKRFTDAERFQEEIREAFNQKREATEKTL